MAPPWATAATPESCAAAKRRAAGKKAARKLACHAGAKPKATAVDPACLAKAEAKFVATFAKLGSTCPGDATAVEAIVDACVDALLADVPGDGRCPAISAKAIGKAANGLAMCAAKELRYPGSFAACDAARDDKLAKMLAKAGACADADTHADLHGACVDPRTAALPTVVTHRCCLRTTPCGAFDQCQVLTEAECQEGGGWDFGPGDCSGPNPCAGATTTPPSACCTAATGGGPRDQCVAPQNLCPCLASDGFFHPSLDCSQNPCR